MAIAKVPLESNIEAYFRREVLRAGGDIRKLTGRKNDPDRIVIWPRHEVTRVDLGDGVVANARTGVYRGACVHFVELKRPGKKPRAGQARRLKRLNDMGCTALYIDTKELVDMYVKGWKPRG